MKYRLNAGYELADFDEQNNVEDVLLVDNNSNRIIILNFTGAFIVHALISEKTKDDILHIIQEHFEVDIEKIEKEVSDMLEMLCQENIIYGYKSVC